MSINGHKQKAKKREWLRYRDFVLSPYGVIKIKSLGYIYVRSERAGKCVKESITHWLEKRLKLKVNERKRAVSPQCERKFLGYSISSGKGRAWILIAPESIRRAKSRLREITGRSKGRSLEQVIGKLRVYLTGWRNYYSLNEL
ncbi:group II intron maturase-specific domain-containing protein [Symbiopectobacterium sp. RP]|uniref:group II intron maturase-specific domain-containing protein n=1 Tax=Symbiopectobacterium sp. RP TaxID=3248553 RepID=UPI003D26C039